MGRLNIEIVSNETDHVGLNGKRFRSPTVLIRVNRSSVSRNVLVMGGLLLACHVADGFLTFAGITTFGLTSEANPYVGRLMATHGVIPGIFIVKTVGVALTLLVMWLAHTRRWLRPFITMSVGAYLVLAVVPWLQILL